jgi:hypothetical protein
VAGHHHPGELWGWPYGQTTPWGGSGHSHPHGSAWWLATPNIFNQFILIFCFTFFFKKVNNILLYILNEDTWQVGNRYIRWSGFEENLMGNFSLLPGSQFPDLIQVVLHRRR